MPGALAFFKRRALPQHAPHHQPPLPAQLQPPLPAQLQQPPPPPPPALPAQPPQPAPPHQPPHQHSQQLSELSGVSGLAEAPYGTSLKVGAFLRAKDKNFHTADAKVVKLRSGDDSGPIELRVHWKGFADRLDEWIPVGKGRLFPPNPPLHHHVRLKLEGCPTLRRSKSAPPSPRLKPDATLSQAGEGEEGAGQGGAGVTGASAGASTSTSTRAGRLSAIAKLARNAYKKLNEATRRHSS